MPWFDSLESRHFNAAGATIHARITRPAQTAHPALLLLHGLPQTHAMGHRVAQLLQDGYFLVIPDLRGYGDSSKPPVLLPLVPS